MQNSTSACRHYCFKWPKRLDDVMTSSNQHREGYFPGGRERLISNRQGLFNFSGSRACFTAKTFL